MRLKLPQQFDNRLGFRIFHILIVFAVFGCSSNNWVLLDNPQVDLSEPSVRAETLFIECVESPSPQNTEITFALSRIRTVQFPLRLAKERRVQNYRPSFFGWTIGLLAGTSAVIISRSESFNDQSELSARNSNLYFFTGLAVIAGSFYMLKPKQEAISTKELQLLQKTGTTTVTDTSMVDSAIPIPLQIDVRHPNIENGLASFSGAWENARFTIDFSEIEWQPIKSLRPDDIEIWITSDMAQFDTLISISSVFTPYVVVLDDNTPVYSSSDFERNPIDIITELNKGTKLKLFYNESDYFFNKVALGITQAFIESSSCEVVWEFGDYETRRFVPNASFMEFGKIDVESDIPKREGKLENSIGIILNSNIDKGLSPIQDRDQRLVQAYFGNTFRLSNDRIFVFEANTFSNVKTVIELNKESPFWNNNKEDGVVYLYINGKTLFTKQKGIIIGGFDEGIILEDLAFDIKNTVSKALIIVVESSPILFQNATKEDFYTWMSTFYATLNSEVDNVAIFISSEPNSSNAVYQSKKQRIDNRHFLFTYAFFNQIKAGNSTAMSMKHNLERNIPFLARSLTDRTQNPIILGGDFDVLLF